MSVYFLDYYHPFAGLCNQLYLITNHIHDAFNKNVKLHLFKFNVDIFDKKRVNASEVIDIDATNKNLNQLTGKFILEKEIPSVITVIPKLCIYPVSSIEILSCLEFNETILKKVNEIKSIFGSKYNAVHFRLDIDAIVHYTHKNQYNHFMELCNKNSIKAKEFFETLDQIKIEKYCLFLLNQYFNFIKQFGFSNVWYISTSITKWEIHEPMKKYLQMFLDFILSNGGIFYISQKVYNERELNALVDLLILRDSIKMIGFEGSSFSEGYCFKVNSVRNPNKEYLFVKEYP